MELVLGALANFKKYTVSFVLSVRLSIRVEDLRYHLMDFHEIWYLRSYGIISREISGVIKI
jgi:hypothetical protein